MSSCGLRRCSVRIETQCLACPSAWRFSLRWLGLWSLHLASELMKNRKRCWLARARLAGSQLATWMETHTNTHTVSLSLSLSLHLTHTIDRGASGLEKGSGWALWTSSPAIPTVKVERPMQGRRNKNTPPHLPADRS